MTFVQVGATNAMRLEAVAKDGRKVVLNYAHEDLEVCVGIATAAFVAATLRGDVSACDHGAARLDFDVGFSSNNRNLRCRSCCLLSVSLVRCVHC